MHDKNENKYAQAWFHGLHFSQYWTGRAWSAALLSGVTVVLTLAFFEVVGWALA